MTPPGQPRVVLFDLDGTLVLTGGAGRKALSRTFGEVFGHPHALNEVDLRGMTDRALLRAGLQAIGRTLSDALTETLVGVYLEHLAREVSLTEGYRVLPGVRDVLESLRPRADVALGLGTGNVERGARIKLSRGALNALFPFGGFGDDAEDRAEVLLAGARRGARSLGQPLEACALVVVGDTPRDVQAAACIGARCVAVATGGYSLSELEQTEPATVLSSLADPSATRAILGV